MEKLPSPITLPKMKSFGVRLCVGGLVRDGFVVGGTRGAKVLGDATTPLFTSFVGGDILDTGPSTVTAGCGETVSAWFATRCKEKMHDLSGTLSVIVWPFSLDNELLNRIYSLVALQLSVAKLIK